MTSVPSPEVVFTAPVASPPTLTQPANQVSAENTNISLLLVGRDPDGDQLTYTATGLPASLSVNAANGLISGTLTFTIAGTYTVTATVSDGSSTDGKTFMWTVTNVNRPPALTPPANRTSAMNATVSLQLLANDPDGDVLAYSAIGLPAPLTINTANGLISGTLVSTSVGAHVATVTVSDGTLSASQTFTWTVRNVAPAVSAFDFDGDGKTDVTVYRPSTGMWYVLQSGTNDTTSVAIAWGIGTDLPVPGDYDGDGKTDIATYRRSNGTWHILQSSTNFAASLAVAWGSSTDILLPGDYDGDGRAEPAVFRTAAWAILRSSSNYATSTVVPWGLSTDVPVPGRP
jgi:PKD repeat protein